VATPKTKFILTCFIFTIATGFNVVGIVTSEEKVKEKISQAGNQSNQVTPNEHFAMAGTPDECHAIGIVPITLPVSSIGGCYFWPSNSNSWSPDGMSAASLTARRTLLITDRRFSQAMVNLSGSTQMLQSKKVQHVPKRLKRGDTFQIIFVGDRVELTMDINVISVGEIHDLGCQYTLFESTLTVTQEKTTCILILQGQCGC